MALRTRPRPRRRLAAALAPALLLLAGCGPTSPPAGDEARSASGAPGASGTDADAPGTLPAARATDAPTSAPRTDDAGRGSAPPDDGESASRETQPPGSAGPLVGTRWAWLAAELPEGRRIAPRDPGAYTIAFLPEGALSVQADCNVGTGTYARKGSGLSLRVQAVTEAMCPEGSLSGEFLALLGGASSYRLDGDGLVIVTGDGATLRMGPGAGRAPVR